MVDYNTTKKYQYTAGGDIEEIYDYDDSGYDEYLEEQNRQEYLEANAIEIEFDNSGSTA
jgi:hypothetical protein